MPEIKYKLFTPFVTTRAQGTGLGLSFTKKVLEDHGGLIRILERPLETGAGFEVILPITVAMEELEKEKGILHVEDLTR